MALEEYRDFTKTLSRPRDAYGPVRKDFRFLSRSMMPPGFTTISGSNSVLLSWAVTQGHSINPSDKRLAVRTEDHPLSYGTFEGTISKGEYGGGTVMLWDQGTWKPKGDPRAGLKKGHLSFELQGDYSAAKSGDRALGALYLGYRKDGALRYGGKVGTGFSMKSARDLVERFDAIPAAKPVLTLSETKGRGAGEWSAVHWLKPVILCEVAFTEWTEDGRIRHPSFQGLREDKDASDVKQEKPASALKKAKASVAKTKPGGIPRRGCAFYAAAHRPPSSPFVKDSTKDYRQTHWRAAARIGGRSH